MQNYIWMYYISARVLNRAVKRGIFRKVTFKQRFEEGEDFSDEYTWGKNVWVEEWLSQGN